MNFIQKILCENNSLGPDRQVFEITKTGQEQLSGALCKPEWATHRPTPPFLTWLALSDLLPLPEKEKMLRSRRNFLQSELLREQKTLTEFPET